MPQTRFVLTLAALAGLLLPVACTSTGPAGGTRLALADPVLPETVDMVPTGAAGDEADGVRSLAREVEVNGGAPIAGYAPPADEGEATPGAAVASLAAPAQIDAPVASDIRGITPTKAAPDQRVTAAGSIAARSSELDALMAHYADYYGVPEELVRRVAKRESTFNPRATNGPYLGLMQISLPTARGMGYRGGREGLLDAETNLKFAVRYLRGAFIVAGGNHDRADRLYQSGYYYHAKRAGLLDETGVGVDRKRRRGA